MESNERQLIKKFLEGDDSAFEELMKKYLKPVYNFLNLLVNDKSALDDITQETFIKVWKNLRRFNLEKNFKVWIFAIAKNTAYDWIKKKKTIPFSVFSDGEGSNKLEEIKENKLLPDEILEKDDFAKELEEKLKEISAQYRLILTMRYKNDLALPEIARVLNLSYNTVKSQHQRALAALRQAFLKNKS